MDIKHIQEVVNSTLSDEQKETLIIDILSQDEKIIPLIMRILDTERKRKDKMTSEMNVLLSKAHIGLDDAKFNSNGFMQKEIVAFYKKWQVFVGHCFKVLDFSQVEDKQDTMYKNE